MLDDAHDKGEETLLLSSASSGRLTDGETTATIENRDPLPRAPLARFVRTTAVDVVEHVEERWQAPRDAGLRGAGAAVDADQMATDQQTQSTCAPLVGVARIAARAVRARAWREGSDAGR